MEMSDLTPVSVWVQVLCQVPFLLLMVLEISEVYGFFYFFLKKKVSSPLGFLHFWLFCIAHFEDVILIHVQEKILSSLKKVLK